jgi:hypothetical protein
MKRPHDMVRTAAGALRGIREEGVADIVRYVCAQQRPDGGFRGRSGASDLYYTVFGLSVLAALNAELPEAPVRRYLDAFGDGMTLDFVHLASGARCRAALSGDSDIESARVLLRRMEAHRAADGTYHHLLPHAPRGTVYGSFLAFLAGEEVGDGVPRPGALLAGIRGLRTADGGYANAPEVAAGTTTATAAAVLLQHWVAGAGDEAAVAALLACECARGGFLASAQAPGPDLLSTATALYALRVAGRIPAAVEPHLGFVEALWADEGGFRGHPADPLADCEYTFYALLALGAGMDGSDRP